MKLQAKRSVFRSRQSQKAHRALPCDTVSHQLALKARRARIKMLLKLRNRLRRAA